MFKNIDIPLLFALTFHAIVFTQSGIDKIINWSENLSFTKETLSEKFPKSLVVIALIAVLLLETIGGLSCLTGAVYAIYQPDCLLFAKTGLLGCGLALLLLLFGQRISQNYEDAKTIAIYFGVCIISLGIVFGV